MRHTRSLLIVGLILVMGAIAACSSTTSPPAESGEESNVTASSAEPGEESNLTETRPTNEFEETAVWGADPDGVRFAAPNGLAIDADGHVQLVVSTTSARR